MEKLKEMIHTHPYGSPRGGDERLRLLAKALAWQASFSRQLGHNDTTRQVLEESLAVLDSPGLAGRDTRVEEAFALYQLGMFQWYFELRLVRPPLMQSLELWRQVGDRWWMAKLLKDLGHLNENAGDYFEAQAMLEESLAIRRQLGDRRGIAETLARLFYVKGTLTLAQESL